MVTPIVKYCPTCGKWTKSAIAMTPGTRCTCDGLTASQQKEVQTLRESVTCTIIDAIEAFYVKHPELRVHFTFTLDAEPAVGRD